MTPYLISKFWYSNIISFNWSWNYRKKILGKTK